MIRFCICKYMVRKFIALFLCVLIFEIPLRMRLPADTDTGMGKLGGAFFWAKKYYLEGKYNETARKLELLLSYIDTEKVDEDDDLRKLQARIWLLLGAANEKLRKIVTARENYKRSNELAAAGKQKLEIEIEEIDFSDLVEYQRIIIGNKNPSVERLILKEAVRPKKKKISPLLAVATIVIMAGLATLFLLKKEQPTGIAFSDNFDTVDLGIEWAVIPAGDFRMGDNFNEGDPDEQPVHLVYLDGYYISKNEITFSQYEIFCHETGAALPPDGGWGRGNRPVIMVTCDSAVQFCAWLSYKTGKNIRLPTEAQWEKAARSINQRRYPWGDDPVNCDRANYCCMDSTSPVGLYDSGVSRYGVHDMAGNVAEWCRDWYGQLYYGNSPTTNPQGPVAPVEPPRFRVVRGGSWDCNSDLSVRSADRGKRIDDVTGKYNDVGFRIVWEGQSPG